MNATEYSNVIPKVSVIVPVYNTEKYLERSLTSLMLQTLEDIEIIIINDGSYDNSLSVIDDVLRKYPERKNQTKLISRKNQGVSATRSEGLKLATGKYVIHLDSDDFVESNWLELLYEKAQKDASDVVVCNFKLVFSQSEILFNQRGCGTPILCIKNLLKGVISNSNCDKLVRRDLFVENGIDFVSGLDMGEDLYVTLQILYYSKGTSFVPNYLYHYNKANEQSLTKSYSKKSLENLVAVTKLIEDFILTNKLHDDLSSELNIFKFNVKNLHFVGSVKDISILKNGLKIYPETNYLIDSAFCSKSLKFAYFLNGFGLLRIFTLYGLIRSFYRCFKAN